ncbi:MAG: DUF1761 domain-containing protein [Bacteroidota bacterium]
MDLENVNILSVALATIFPALAGMIFYHPKLFGNAWLKTLGLDSSPMNRQNPVVTAIISLSMSFLLTFWLMNFSNGPGQEGQFDNFQHGAWHGVFVALIICVPVLVLNGRFEGRSGKNLLINVLFWTLTLALMSGFLDAMNHWPNEGVSGF